MTHPDLKRLRGCSYFIVLTALLIFSLSPVYATSSYVEFRGHITEVKIDPTTGQKLVFVKVEEILRDDDDVLQLGEVMPSPQPGSSEFQVGQFVEFKGYLHVVDQSAPQSLARFGFGRILVGSLLLLAGLLLVPGFPMESIIAGLAVGVVGVAAIRRTTLNRRSK